MAVSQGSITTGPAGLKLKAHGFIKGDSTLMAGFNVASAVRKAATSGTYVVTFATAMATADYFVLLRVNTGASSTPPYQTLIAKTAAGFTVECTQYQGVVDPLSLHFEIYEA